MSTEQAPSSPKPDPIVLERKNTIGFLSFFLCIIGYAGIYFNRNILQEMEQPIPYPIMLLDSLTPLAFPLALFLGIACSFMVSQKKTFGKVGMILSGFFLAYVFGRLLLASLFGIAR